MLRTFGVVSFSPGGVMVPTGNEPLCPHRAPTALCGDFCPDWCLSATAAPRPPAPALPVLFLYSVALVLRSAGVVKVKSFLWKAAVIILIARALRSS